MTLPPPRNEPVRDYAPGSPERSSLAAALHGLAAERPELPLIIGGEEVRTGRLAEVRIPHAHQEVLATWHAGDRPLIERAIAAAEAARAGMDGHVPRAARGRVPARGRPPGRAVARPHQRGHDARPVEDRSPGRDRRRVRAHRLLALQPLVRRPAPGRAAGVAARQLEPLEYRPLEGFVFAVTPFNFTSIAGNLPTAPALMGNTVIWKPPRPRPWRRADMRLLQAAGLPDGVINLVAGNARDIADVVLAHESFAGLHFTGSTEVFQSLWRDVGSNVARYRSYPRLVGETGGKDFIVAHASADVDGLATAIVRGAFEYQGQKCSAASRALPPATTCGRRSGTAWARWSPASAWAT